MAYQSNPPSVIPLVQRPPTRIVASGTITIAPSTAQLFVGSNNRTDRVEIIVTNLDLQVLVKVQTKNGINGMTVFPQTAEGLETNDDVNIFNPSASASIQVEVLELYPDIGNLHGVPTRIAANAAPGGGGTAAGGSGGGPAGGSAGGAGIGGGGGVGQPR